MEDDNKNKEKPTASEIIQNKIRECSFCGAQVAVSTAIIGLAISTNFGNNAVKKYSLIPIFLGSCGFGYFIKELCETETNNFFDKYEYLKN